MSASVTVVICNFNKAQDLVRAINSVLYSEDIKSDIVVVDNASTDASVAEVRKNFGETVDLVALPENIGGSGGFATGMRRALDYASPYVLLLDNDAHVARDSIRQLVTYLEQHPECAVAAPTILVDGHDDLVQELGGKLTKQYTFGGNFKGAHYNDLPQAPLVCDYAPACCLLTRRSVLEKVGAFDQDYFLYWDDIEWCQRIRLQGYGETHALPPIKAWHRGGGAANPMARYYQWRNCLRFYSRDFNQAQWSAFSRVFTQRAMTSLLNTYLSEKRAITTSIMAALEDATQGRFGKCSHPAMATLPAPIEHDIRHSIQLDHVFDPCPTHTDWQSTLSDSFGNHIKALKADEIAQFAAFACKAAELIHTTLESLVHD